MTRPGGSRWRRFGGRLWGLVALALLLFVGGRLFPAVATGQYPAPWGILVNPCTGERIALQERPSFLPHLTPGQGGSREASVNAVGLTGLGSRGTYYLPLGTGKAVLTLADGTLAFTAGGDLELIGRDSRGQDYYFHSLAQLKLSVADGLRGSGFTLRSRCG